MGYVGSVLSPAPTPWLRRFETAFIISCRQVLDIIVDSLLMHTSPESPRGVSYQGVWDIREGHTMKLFMRKINSHFCVLHALHLDCTSLLSKRP